MHADYESRRDESRAERPVTNRENILLKGFEYFFETEDVRRLYVFYTLHKLQGAGAPRAMADNVLHNMYREGSSEKSAVAFNAFLDATQYTGREHNKMLFVGRFFDFLDLTSARDVDSVSSEYDDSNRLAFIRFMEKENPEFLGIMWNQLLT